MAERDKAADAWLEAIGREGWRGATPDSAALPSGLAPEDMARLVGDRFDAVAALQDRVAVAAAEGAAPGAGLATPRERLFDGLMQGFDVLQASRPAVLAIWGSRDPGVALLLSGRAGLHVRRLANAAGIDTGGIRGQLRLVALAGLCLQAFAVWRADDSSDMAATMAELDRLLERAERAEVEGLSPDLLGLPGLTGFFARWRPRGRADPAPRPGPVPPEE